MKVRRGGGTVLMIAAMTATMIACESERRVTEPSAKPLGTANVSAGKLHNEALAYAFSRLSEAGSQGLTRKEAIAIAQRGVVQFAMAHTSTDAKARELVGAGFDLARGWKPVGSGGELTPAGNSASAELLRETSISPRQTPYVQRILRVARSFPDHGVLRDSLETITLNARESLSSGDIAVIQTTASVAIHSNRYWHEHGQEWVNLLRQHAVDASGGISSVTTLEEGDPNGDVDWGNVGSADVIGAGAGAAASLAGCAEATLGACALVGGALGGAGASLGAALLEIGDWLF